MTVYWVDAYAVIDLGAVAAVVFDTDGVVIDSAQVHAQAWKQTFDELLRSRGTRPFEPFDVRNDYLAYIDGKPRLDGARGFLTARGLTLTDAELRALGDRKDAAFMRHVRRYGVAAFPATVALVRELRRCGAATAAVSASIHCAEVLQAAGVLDMFDLRVDGAEAARLGLAGEPGPVLFLEAARRLGVAPSQVAVVEDSLAGVEAARLGGFELVLGVDRRGQVDDLYGHGADAVVSDLAEVWVTGRRHKPAVVTDDG